MKKEIVPFYFCSFSWSLVAALFIFNGFSALFKWTFECRDYYSDPLQGWVAVGFNPGLRSKTYGRLFDMINYSPRTLLGRGRLQIKARDQ